MNRFSIVSALAGLALLVGAPVAWSLSQPEETVGDLDAVAAPVSTDAPVTDAPVLDLEEPDAILVPEVDESDTTAREAAPEPVAAPTKISLPSIDADAPIVDVGLEDDGGMEIPDDVSTAGWYELGVAPGEASGTAVISGHVDSESQGRGAFWDLRRMEVDDIVTVDHADGTASQWRVVARTSYPKDELPIADIFTRFGDPRLVLITCDGAFDRDARSYSDNVVVYTVPVDA
ncbi:MAG: class F sortase [Actinomycetota bacterium]